VRVAALLRQRRHDAWTAFEANLQEADDRDLIIYADDKQAILVTINKDCVAFARRMQAARVVYLRCEENRAVTAIGRQRLGFAPTNFPLVGCFGYRLRLP
jgi:predicted nuclease of predicted toxin-antitoxin system